MHQQEQIVRQYIAAYNQKDVPGMIRHMAERIVFQNISNGELTMELKGLNEFTVQAEKAVDLFRTRQQTVTKIGTSADETAIDVDYFAVLAIDLPNGMKTGDELNLKGNSVFTFNGDKIVGIKDIS